MLQVTKLLSDDNVCNVYVILFHLYIILIMSFKVKVVFFSFQTSNFVSKLDVFSHKYLLTL